MQSEAYHELINKLADITDRVKYALVGKNFAAMEQLTLEHKTVMAELYQIGPCHDQQMLDPVTKVSNQVNDLVLEIKCLRDGIGLHMQAAGNRKKLAVAYGRI